MLHQKPQAAETAQRSHCVVLVAEIVLELLHEKAQAAETAQQSHCAVLPEIGLELLLDFRRVRHGTEPGAAGGRTGRPLLKKPLGVVALAVFAAAHMNNYAAGKL